MLQDTFADKATERKILSLLITCPSEGCQWTGELRSKDVSSNRMCICELLLTPNSKHNPLIFIGWNITQQIQLQKTQLLPEEIYSSVNQFNISWLEKKIVSRLPGINN